LSTDPGGTDLAIPRRTAIGALLAGRRYKELRGGLLYLLSSFAFQGTRLFATLVAAAILGPEQLGVWALAVAILSYTPFATGGAVNAMNREVAILLGQGRVDDAVRSEATALGASIASAVALLVTLTAGALLIGAQPGFAIAFGLAAGFQQIAFCYQATLRARVRFTEAAVAQLAMAVAFLALGIPGLFAWGLSGLIVAQAAAYALVTLIAAIRWRRDLVPTLARPILGSQVRTGLPIALSGLAFACLTNQDRWVVAAFGTPEDLGQYGFASTMASGLTLLVLVIGQQLYPRMGFALGRSGRAAAAGLARRQSVIALAATTGGGVALFAGTAALVLGALPAYTPSLLPLAILCVGSAILALASGPTNLLVVIGSARMLVLVYAMGAVVALALGAAMLTGGAGLAGAAVGTVVGSVVVVVAATLKVRS